LADGAPVWYQTPTGCGWSLSTSSYLSSCAGDCYYYRGIASPDYTLQPGDILEYDVYISPLSPTGQSGVDLIATGWRLRDSGAVDQNGVGASPYTDIGSYARGRWYHRSITIPPSGAGAYLGGGTGSGVFLALEGNVAGSAIRTHVAGVRITRNGVTRASIYGCEPDIALPSSPAYTMRLGYTATTSTTIQPARLPLEGETATTCWVDRSGDYSVTVTNAGGCSGDSAVLPVSPDTAPQSPGDSLRIARAGDSLPLSWAACPGAVSYSVFSNAQPLTDPAAFTLAGSSPVNSLALPSGSAPLVWYKVEAVNGSCSSP
jgi:hypothetical protein